MDQGSEKEISTESVYCCNESLHTMNNVVTAVQYLIICITMQEMEIVSIDSYDNDVEDNDDSSLHCQIKREK